MTIAECLGVVAPYYNLVFVIIVVLLFLKLFRLHNDKIFLKPWKLLGVAVLIYIFEEVITVLKKLSILDIPRIWNAVFELVMIALFIYLTLLQKEFLKKDKSKKIILSKGKK